MNALQLAVALLWATLVIERIVHILIRTILYIVFRNRQDQEKGRAGLGLLLSIVNASLSLMSSLITLFFNTLASLFQWSTTLVVLLIVIGFLLLAMEFSGHLMLSLSTAWSYTLGPSAQVLIIWPLRVFSTVFDAIVPLWNAYVWISTKVPYQLLVRTVTEDLGTLVAAGQAFAGLCRSLALSLVGWIGSFICCLSDADYAAAVEGTAFCNPQCFEAGNRVFDLMSPMANLRRFVVYAALWLKDLCGMVAAPLDLITYPFMDIHFAEFVHLETNAVLFSITHLPALTSLRCSLHGSESAVMCIPDFEPIFQLSLIHI